MRQLASPYQILDLGSAVRSPNVIRGDRSKPWLESISLCFEAHITHLMIVVFVITCTTGSLFDPNHPTQQSPRGRQLGCYPHNPGKPRQRLLSLPLSSHAPCLDIRPIQRDKRGQGSGYQASRQQKASHLTVSIVFLANDRCLRDYDLVAAHC